jgi:hypothetical protein
MFGYRGGEPQQITDQKISERKTAQAKWPFLTTLDLSTIHSEEQLVFLIKDRTGASIAQVRPIVHDWMAGYRHRAAKSLKASGGQLRSRLSNRPQNHGQPK